MDKFFIMLAMVWIPLGVITWYYYSMNYWCINAGGDYIDKICVNRDRVNDVEFIFNKEEGMQQVFWSFSDKIQPDNSMVLSQIISWDNLELMDMVCSKEVTSTH